MAFSMVNGFRDLSMGIPLDSMPFILFLLEKGALVIDEKRFREVMMELKEESMKEPANVAFQPGCEMVIDTPKEKKAAYLQQQMILSTDMSEEEKEKYLLDRLKSATCIYQPYSDPEKE